MKNRTARSVYGLLMVSSRAEKKSLHANAPAVLRNCRFTKRKYTGIILEYHPVFRGVPNPFTPDHELPDESAAEPRALPADVFRIPVRAMTPPLDLPVFGPHREARDWITRLK